MNRDASTIFKKLFETGSTAFKSLRNIALSPDSTKILREWGITEAARMVGRTPQTLRNLEDLEKIPKARVVANGKRKERTFNLQEINQLREYFGTRLSKPHGTKSMVLGFGNFKGGAGKTTTAINTAQYFALHGYRVLFIDCDSQGSATQMFGYIPDEDLSEEDTLLNVLTGDNKNLSGVIKKTYWDSLDLIPANLSLYNAELIIPTQISNHSIQTGSQLPFYDRLNESLESVKSHYDVIIIDCPPSMGMISINAIFASDALIIEMPPVIVDFASTIQFFKMVSEILERLPEKKYSFVRILLTKYNNRKTANNIKELMRSFFGQYLMPEPMVESEVIYRAVSEMQTLYELDASLVNKKTYDRAIQKANEINEELERLVKLSWEKMQSKKEVPELEIGEI